MNANSFFNYLGSLVGVSGLTAAIILGIITGIIIVIIVLIVKKKKTTPQKTKYFTHGTDPGYWSRWRLAERYNLQIRNHRRYGTGVYWRIVKEIRGH